MPKIRPSERLPPGWEKISAQMELFEQQMRDITASAGAASGVAGPPAAARKPKREASWPIARVNFSRTRYLHKMLKRKEISAEVVAFCVDQGLADGALLSKWRLPGYECLCCISCVNPKNFSASSGCICRVPASQRKGTLGHGGGGGCATCGCTGCCTADRRADGAVVADGDAGAKPSPSPAALCIPSATSLEASGGAVVEDSNPAAPDGATLPQDGK